MRTTKPPEELRKISLTLISYVNCITKSRMSTYVSYPLYSFFCLSNTGKVVSGKRNAIEEIDLVRFGSMIGTTHSN